MQFPKAPIRGLLSATLLASALLCSVTAFGQTSQRLAHLRHVDLRDLVLYTPSHELPGTANLIMKALEAPGGTGRFLGTVGSDKKITPVSSRVTFVRSGALGPEGQVEKEGSGVEVFRITKTNEETRRNTILGAAFEDIIDEQFNSPHEAYRFKLILFVHDASNPTYASSGGFYFRRLWIKVDYNIPREQEASRLQILQHEEDIPLKDTSFKITGDLLERKAILEDTRHHIYKVFPLGVGAVDARTGRNMDMTVGLTTGEFPNAALIKNQVYDTGPRGPNTRARIKPAYYAGRPFIGLYPEGKPELYQLIGMHYQIEGTLSRGFVSHGCIRVRDMDLYQLDAIVNEGPLSNVPAVFLNNPRGYEDLQHPMPKIRDRYKTTVYSDLPSRDKVNCVDSEHTVKWRGAKPGYHTVADEDCLALTEWVKESDQTVVDFMRGVSPVPPKPFLTKHMHVPDILVAVAQADQGVTSGNGVQVQNLDAQLAAAQLVWESESSQAGQTGRRRTLVEQLLGIHGSSGGSAGTGGGQPVHQQTPTQPQFDTSTLGGKIMSADHQINQIIGYINYYCTSEGIGRNGASTSHCNAYYTRLHEWRRYRASLGQ